MRNIKLEIQYDGARYEGWERPSKGKQDGTIRGKIEEVLNKMTGEKVELIGGVRTGNGVHAECQIANFHTDCKMKCYEIKHYLNRYLPRDIAVHEVSEADERFHSKLNIKSVIYEYRIQTGEVPDVFKRKYSFYCFDRLDIKLMKEAAAYIKGKHDFKAFCANKRMTKSTVREMYDVDIYQDDQEVLITLHANGFLTHMPQIIIGTLISIGTGDRDPIDMKKVLDSLVPEEEHVAAQSQGLFLSEIKY